MGTATTTRPISGAQVSFINNLLDQRDVPVELAAEIVAGMDSWTTRQASAAIDVLKSLPYKAQQQDTTVDLADEPGLYEVDGVLFHVKSNRSKTNIYAMRLTDDGYEYAGAIRKNKIEKKHRITIERAVELSGARGQCIRCLRTLSDPKSIKRSMGKWCSDRI